MKPLYKPISELPSVVEGESFSITVLLFDKNLDNFDLGYYDFDISQWVAMGGFQIEVICWSEIIMPSSMAVLRYTSILIE
ncbi:hypothetical protein [Chryseobacterium sp. 2VB]|uniref:hypothetical protein n=1 Tax=Chryseobacterium sp. 2VB TaxID=2502204 RepID=UPI0010F6E573|nr:hypothetical protein [Chryseobacterium sp. 2VB]